MNWQGLAETFVCSVIGSMIGSTIAHIWFGPWVRAIWEHRCLYYRVKRQVKRDLAELRKMDR